MPGQTKSKFKKNFTEGGGAPPPGGELFENPTPADTRDVVAIFQRSGQADVDAAVDAAKRAYAKWRLVPAPHRAEIIFRASEMLLERKEEYSRDMTREMGKVIKETRGDTQEAIDTGYFMAGAGPRPFCPPPPPQAKKKIANALLQPGGGRGIVSPRDFPLAPPSW